MNEFIFKAVSNNTISPLNSDFVALACTWPLSLKGVGLRLQHPIARYDRIKSIVARIASGTSDSKAALTGFVGDAETVIKEMPRDAEFFSLKSSP